MLSASNTTASVGGGGTSVNNSGVAVGETTAGTAAATAAGGTTNSAEITSKPDLLTAVNWFFALQPPAVPASVSSFPIATATAAAATTHHATLPTTASNPPTHLSQIIPAPTTSIPAIHVPATTGTTSHHPHHHPNPHSSNNSVSSWNTKMSYSSATTSASQKKRKRKTAASASGGPVSISSGETTVESSSERKRIREQNRRAAFARGVDSMAKVLCQIDPHLRQSSDGGGVFSNQLRVIHHATTILERIHEESLKHKAIVEELEAKQQQEQRLSQRRVSE